MYQSDLFISQTLLGSANLVIAENIKIIKDKRIKNR